MRHPTIETVQPEDLAALVRASWSEAEFTAEVIGLARENGWRCAHFRPARTARGWRTAVSGDGKGFVDAVLVHAARRKVLWRELKTDKGVLSREQAEWLRALQDAGQDAAVWRPSMWAEIVEQLTC